MAITKPTSSFVWFAAVADVVLVLVFVVIGRLSHDEGVTFFGVLETWWPFLVGLALGWVTTRAWRAPAEIVWNGIAIWVITVVMGMLLRIATGQGAAFAFVIVATVVVGVFLLGWRAIARVVLHRSSKRNRS